MRTLRTVVVPGRPAVGAADPGPGVIRIPLRGRPQAIALRMAASGVRAVGVSGAAVVDVVGTPYDNPIMGVLNAGNLTVKDSTDTALSVHTFAGQKANLTAMCNGVSWTGSLATSRYNMGVAMALPGVFLLPSGAVPSATLMGITELQPDIGSWVMDATEVSSIPSGEIQIPGAFALVIPLKSGLVEADPTGKELELHFLNYACAPAMLVVEVIY